MENQDSKKLLDSILEKVSKCIPLNEEELKLRDELVNKLLDAKKCVRKTFETRVGNDIKKTDASPTLKKPEKTGSASEAPNPKNRGKEGGYDSKADIAERTEVSPDPAKTPNATRETDLSDKKEEKRPKEDSSGKVKEEYLKDDNINTDNKEHENVFYEEDRVGRYTEHGNPKDSIKVKDIVVKSLSNGNKLVGQVLKVYEPRNGQRAIMVKWASGTFSHVNERDVQVLKAGDTAKKYLEFAPGEPVRIPAGGPSDVPATGKEHFEFSPKEPVKIPKGGPSDISTTSKTEEKMLETEDIKKPIVEKANNNGFPPHVHVHLHGPGSTEDEKSETQDTSVVPEKPVVTDKIPAATPEKPTEQKTPVVSEKPVTVPTEPATDNKPTELPQEPPQEFIQGAIEALREITDLSDEEITDLARSAWDEIRGEQSQENSSEPDNTIVTEPDKKLKTEKTVTPDKVYSALSTTAGPGIREEDPSRMIHVKPGQEVKVTPKKAEATGDVEKGEAPPSKWLEDCKAALERDNADVENPYAICTATYQRSKGLKTGDVVKISADEMKTICPNCAEKMMQKNIKYYKFTF